METTTIYHYIDNEYRNTYSIWGKVNCSQLIWTLLVQVSEEDWYMLKTMTNQELYNILRKTVIENQLKYFTVQ